MNTKIPLNWEKVQNLLVVRLDNMGDALMCTPVFRAIKENLPGVKVTFWVSPAGGRMAPLLPGIDAIFVREVVWQDTKGKIPLDSRRELQLAQDLAIRKFDAALILTSFSQSPFPPAYVCYLAEIPIRVAQSKEFGGGLLTTWIKPQPDPLHQVDRNLYLLEGLGFSVGSRQMVAVLPTEAEAEAAALLEQSGVKHDGYFLIHPGASCAARAYPGERYAEVARLLVQTHRMPIVVTGNTKEQDLANQMKEIIGPQCISLTGETTVPVFAALIETATAVITNNTSALHLADAFRRPNVILYSGTDYETQWKPRWSPTRILRRPTHCSPCYLFACPYHLECLDIPPEEVAQAVAEVMQVERHENKTG